jgi:cytochrome c oxidase accessory protein FixG
MLASLKDKMAHASEPVEAADGVARSDALAVNSAAHRSLYQKREQIYPKLVHGFWRQLKWAVLVALLGIYYAAPLIRWERPGLSPDQFVLADFPGRRLYFGPIELWPQEIYFISGLLILGAVGLFLASALFGRLWCGYACPQTVWTDLFMAVERWFEGDRNQRIRLDKAAWGPEKIARKGGKHVVWLLISLATGGWFIAYFHDAPTVLTGFFTGHAPASAYLFAGLLTFTTYMLAGTLREQVCTYMCPWPRIQGAMVDADTMQVAYRYDRGDPRGPHKKGQSWDGRGDCIDCRACVAACPMGIDIRDGAQIECINCALCIDACDDIMGKIGRPKGLIHYDTDQNCQRRAAGLPATFRPIRSRTIFYAAIFAVVGAIMIGLLATRSSIDLNVLRDRNPTYVRLSDGSVRNAYTVKIINKAATARDVVISIDGIAGSSLRAVDAVVVGDEARVRVEPDRVRPVRIFLIAPPGATDEESTPVTVRVTASDGEQKTNRTVFLSEDDDDEHGERP